MTPYTQEQVEALKWADSLNGDPCWWVEHMTALAALVRSQAEEIAGLVESYGNEAWEKKS